MGSAPPEEPHFQSEPSILSPASPKPIHFPTPTNIPVLENQMDVAYNQTEAHMSDPAMHDTEVRPDVWRDPNEQQREAEADHASPFSTGGEAMETTDETGVQATEEKTDSNDTDSHAADPEPQPAPVSNTASHEANGNLEMEVTSEAQPTDIVQPSSDPSVPTAEASAPNPTNAFQTQPELYEVEQTPSASTFNGGVDVQSLLDTLQTAPASTTANAGASANTAPPADGMTVATTLTPSQQPYTPSQQAPPGIEDASSPLSASGLGAPPSGLPPRPPPQEQPLIHPNYVHSQHIRDYHPHAAHPAFQPHARSTSGSQSQGNVADLNSKNYVPPVHSPSGGTLSALPQSATLSTPSYSANAASIPGSAYVPNGQPSQYATPGSFAASPATATSPGFAGSPQNMYAPNQYPMTNTPIESRREIKLRDGEMPRPEDRPWDAEVQRKYDEFIEDERRFVSEGRWEQFPQGSRLFVGTYLIRHRRPRGIC